MAETWFYLHDGKPAGPVEHEAVAAMLRGGSLGPASYVWKDGMADWLPVAEIAELRPLMVPRSVFPPPPMPGAHRRDGLLGNLAAGISHYSELPTLSGVPIRHILLGGLRAGPQPLSIEDELIVGTAHTTPPLAALPTAWPTPRIFWRIFGGALATYMLLQVGLWEFNNLNFVPGMIVIGSFVVPLSIVILFFELNSPRNVSIYQVGKMFMLGGALSLVLTMFVNQVIPWSGAGNVFQALLTGVVEETGKAMALLLVVGVTRYRWEANGLLFGAAVGAGFAGFESAGYAFTVLLSDRSLGSASMIILIRGLLAPGGHVIWTAMVGSALWKIKKDRPFNVSMLFHPTVMRRWGIAVVLHGLWDTDIWLLHPWIKDSLLLILGWYIIFAIMKEALAQVAAAQQTVLTQVILAQGQVGA
jgi:RsiW-degrading membrane proteinase PrsW (M82 family)